jgi:hypothetical protein
MARLFSVFFHYITGFLLLAVTCSMALPASVFAAGNSQTYIVKLTSANAGVLAGVADTAVPQFTFSHDEAFANVYQITSTFSLAELTTALGSEAVYVHPDQKLQTELDAIIANDPGFTTNTANIDKQWGLAKAHFPEAWRKTTGSSKTVVAVVDTGIDETHEDFANTTFVPGYNIADNKAIPLRTNSDDNGHGTLVAGIIGASSNNAIGVTGTNWQVSLMPVKALNSAGSGEASDLAQGIVWAADNGAQVINLSVGGLGFAHDLTLANAIKYAFDKNVVIVAASGNDVATTGGNLDENPVFPICDDNGQNMVIGVTATDTNDLKAGFANYGRSCVDVSAPGKRILSTINVDPLSAQKISNSYAYASGTSLAAPFVSGQAALLRSAFPQATNKQIRDRIIASADPIDDLNITQCAGKPCTGLIGAGRINVQKSLEQDISILKIADGDVVQVASTGELYFINGGKKQPVSPFVRNQRFASTVLKSVEATDIASFPEGPYAAPLDGTLVKSDKSLSVFYVQGGIRMPVVYSVFTARGFSFSSVISLSDTELNAWVTGSLLVPPDGALLRGVKNKTVYWVVGGVLHPITAVFYEKRGLSIFPLLTLPDNDVAGFTKGAAYLD